MADFETLLTETRGNVGLILVVLVALALRWPLWPVQQHSTLAISSGPRSVHLER